MAFMLTRVRVDDYEAWKPVFDADPAGARTAATGHRILRNAEDPNELFVQVGSVTLGAGKPLLPRTITSPPLRLLTVRAVGTGFAELHYEVPRPADG